MNIGGRYFPVRAGMPTPRVLISARRPRPALVTGARGTTLGRPATLSTSSALLSKEVGLSVPGRENSDSEVRDLTAWLKLSSVKMGEKIAKPTSHFIGIAIKYCKFKKMNNSDSQMLSQT